MLAELDRKSSPEYTAQFTWIRQSLKGSKELILEDGAEKLTIKIGDPKMLPLGYKGEVLVLNHALSVNAQDYSVNVSESFDLDEDGLLMYGAHMRSNFIANPFLMNSIIFPPKSEFSRVTQKDLEENNARKINLEGRVFKLFERMIKSSNTSNSSKLIC